MSRCDVMMSCLCSIYFFFFNDPATTEIYTLSLHDALPISDLRARAREVERPLGVQGGAASAVRALGATLDAQRSEEHTSELQSQFHLVCRLLLEKKKKIKENKNIRTHKFSYSTDNATQLRS